MGLVACYLPETMSKIESWELHPFQGLDCAIANDNPMKNANSWIAPALKLSSFSPPPRYYSAFDATSSASSISAYWELYESANSCKRFPTCCSLLRFKSTSASTTNSATSRKGFIKEWLDALFVERRDKISCFRIVILRRYSSANLGKSSHESYEITPKNCQKNKTKPLQWRA